MPPTLSITTSSWTSSPPSRASTTSTACPSPSLSRRARCSWGSASRNKTVDDLEKDLKLEARQLLANFNKVVVRITKFLRSLREEHAEKSLARKQTISGQTVTMSLDDELSKDAKAAHKKLLAAAENAARGGGGGGRRRVRGGRR